MLEVRFLPGGQMNNVNKILIGISCDHKRMKHIICAECKKRNINKRNIRYCYLECPDCGLEWDSDDDRVDEFYYRSDKRV